MRIKDGFMLKEIVGTLVVVPVGQRIVEFNCMMTLSESGAFLWKKLENDIELDDLVQALSMEYEVEESIARNDVEEFVTNLREKKLLED